MDMYVLENGVFKPMLNQSYNGRFEEDVKDFYSFI